MRRLIWTSRALDDIDGITDFLSEKNPIAAQELAIRCFDIVKNLQSHPELGRASALSDSRELIVSGTNYLIGYRVLPDRIEVLGVWHGRRLPPG